MKCICGVHLDTDGNHIPITCICGRLWDWVDVYEPSENSWFIELQLQKDLGE